MTDTSSEREKIYQAVKNNLEQNIFYHSLALEACLAGIYDYLQDRGELGPDEPLKGDWLLAGLAHDIDYAGEFKAEHPRKTVEALAKYGLQVSASVLSMIKAHAPELTGQQPQNKAQWAIMCTDSLTGLIIACALILPTKKLADVKLASVLKRFLKDPKFAAGTRRQEVALCASSEGLNIPVEKFCDICLTSMQNIASEIGL